MSKRIEDLISRMTLPEKIGQLVTRCDFSDELKERVRQGLLGSIFTVQSPEVFNEVQKLAVEGSRLGIPVLFGLDVIHGHRTMFPLPLAQAASWDPAVVEMGSAVAAKEASAEGIHWTFAPMVDIARDPRWGRIAEGYGEDTYLCSKMAAAAVRGFQGTDISAPERLLACAKHYAAYGAAEGGRDYNTVDISERALREVYLPSFKAAVDAGVGTLMSSFNEIAGVPSTGNRHLLTEILRDEWGFDGFVVSDYDSVIELVMHGFAADKKEAAQKAITAGLDMEMMGGCYVEELANLVEEGTVPMAVVDEAVRRVLRIKERLGLFENPYVDVTRAPKVVLCDEFKAAARDAARRSMVLLKNDGDLLPLSKDVKSVAVIGPYVTDEKAFEWRGCWTVAGESSAFTSFADAVRGTVSPGTDVKVDAGDDPDFAGAVAAAKASQVAIVVVGEDADRAGEYHCVSDIGLQGNQEELVKAVVATGTPTVVVLINGRPLACPWIAENAPAILEAWHSGTMGTWAATDILFGDANPGGKLPVTFPRATGQIPMHYNHKNTGRPAWTVDYDPNNFSSRYMDLATTPLYPFGFGLSYTTFEYSDLALSQKTIKPDETITVSATVTNTGKREGDEIVQCYIRDVAASTTRPIKELRGFTRITLAPSESRKVSFDLGPQELSLLDPELKRVVEPGVFRVWISTNSRDGLEGEFVVES